MATVQMPDGALVELPDDADDELKERIRQKVEALRNQAQPQGTPTPSPDEPIYQPSASPEAPRGGYFVAKAGVAPEQAHPPEGPALEVERGLGDVVAGIPQMVAALPRYAYEGVKLATEGPTAENVGTILQESVPMGKQLAQEATAPLGTRESTRGLAQILMMAVPAVGELAGAFRGVPRPPVQTNLRSAFDSMFGKAEPISDTPLSDAATKEVTDASQPSNAQVETREAPQRIETRPESEVPRPSDSDNALREAQREKEQGLVSGPTEEQVTETGSGPVSAPKIGDIDHEARALEADTAAEEKATGESGQTTFEDLAQKLTKEEEARLKAEYEQGLLEDVEQHQARGGDELGDLLKQHGLQIATEAGHYSGELNRLRGLFERGTAKAASPITKEQRVALQSEYQNAVASGDTAKAQAIKQRLSQAQSKRVSGYGKAFSGQGDLRYSDVFKTGGLTLDQFHDMLVRKGFDVGSISDTLDLIENRIGTGKKLFGSEARAEASDITGLEGYAMGAAGTREIPIQGWKDMLEAGERTPVETTDSLARAKGTIGKILDAVGSGFRNARDFITVNAIPKLTRAGLADAAYEHASARNSVVHSVRHLLSRVFPDEYKNPAAMQRTGDILTKDNILGVYDQAQERLAQAEPGTPEYDAAADAVSKIEEAHNLVAYDRDVKEAMNDPKLSRNIERWKTWVNPEMDRMYNEIKSLDPWTIQESRGRNFGARINLLPLDQAADLSKFADMSQAMPDIVTSNYRNPNIKKDPFMRRASGTGQYSTDPGLILTNSLARRYNEVTKLRLYNAVEQSGNGFITDAGVRPDVTQLGGEDLTRMAVKMPETDPKTGRTRVVEKSLWIKKSLARETRDVLNTDMAAPTNPVFKALTQLQLMQLADATAHMKNIHTVVANSLGASKPWQDAVRKMPFLATADTVGRIAQVTREVAADTPAIRDEIAQMAKQGMIRPQYPATGIQRVTKMQDAIHHVDTASRIIMNRFWDNLVQRGVVNDSMQGRRAFVQQIGEYNGRLMGQFSRTMRNYGASPFIVAGRTFNAFSKRLITGDPGFKAATPQAAAAARAYQLTALTLATTLPAIINYAITGKFGGRPGTPIGAIDTGMNNEKGDKKIIDLFQLMGIRRGLRATGLGAVIEGAREGKSVNEIGGKAIEDITTTASHPWLGPALAGAYSGITGKRLDLRGGGWPYDAKRIKEGGLKQNAENLRVALKNQNPLIYGLIAPLIGETEDTYGEGLARGLLKPFQAPFGYVEKPGDSAFSNKREKTTGVKVKP